MGQESLWSDIVFPCEILEILFNVDANKLRNHENGNQSDNKNDEFISD